MRRVRPILVWLLVGVATAGRAPAQTNVSTLVFPGQTGQLLYPPDARGNRIPDFSRVGYRSGDAPLPDVTTQVATNRWVYVAPAPGPSDAAIQAAIGQVSGFATNSLGLRGVVQLLAGEFVITNQLVIRTNGVVLRGMGDGADTNSNTILRSTSTNQISLIDVGAVSGSRSAVANTTRSVIDKVVPVGATSFRVDSTNNWAVGSRLIVLRPGTSNWISALGMDTIPQNATTDVVQWAEGTFDQLYERVITRLESNRVFLDAPLPTVLDQQYGGGTAYRFTFTQRVSQVGIENLRAESAFASDTDEAHAWSFIDLDRVEDCWVRNITARYFAFSAVILSTTASRVTVTDAQCLEPKSQITGGRRYAFNNQGQLNLMRDLFSEQGRHDFVNNSPSRGPNVFYNGIATNMNSEAGPHQRWSTGTLYDTLRCHGDTLAAYNRGSYGTGHGYSGAQMVFWNCRADAFWVENPPTARNWVIGGVGTVVNPGNPPDFLNTPIGTYDRHGTNVTLLDPANNPGHSLYVAQVNERGLSPGIATRDYALGDFDDAFYDGTNSADQAPVDPAWTNAVQGVLAGGGVTGFDQGSTNVHVPFTFDYRLDPGEQVAGAVLAVGLRRTGATTTNAAMWVESATNRLSFAALGLTNSLPTNSTTVLLYEFPLGALGPLQDGRLNVLVGADVAVDWATLRLRVGPVSAPVTASRTAVADAFVRGGVYQTTNYGTESQLAVKANASPGFERRAYLRFDPAGVTGTVLEARLRLRCSSVSDPVTNALAFVTNQAWTETGITWSNAPPGGPVFATWAPESARFVEIPVTSYVQAALAGSSTVSFLVSSLSITSNGFVNYDARESGTATNRPQLLITTADTTPTVSALTNLVVTEDGSSGPVAFTVADVETPAGQLAVSATSSLPTLIPPAGLVVGGSGSNRTLTVTPATNGFGTATVTVQASDGVSAGARAFTVTVSPVNDAPVLAPVGDRALGAGQVLTVALSASDPDDPAQPFVFAMPVHPAGAAVNATNGLLTWRPAVAQAGSSNLFIVQASDNGGPVLTSTQQFQVVVAPLQGPSVTSAAFTPGGDFQLVIAGGAGPDYTVQASADLLRWTNVFTTNSPAPPFPWLDTNTAPHPQRFYRVRVGP